MELGELPEELVGEILRRQSFKDTLKNKFVCRRWEAIVSDPTFLQYRRRLRSQSSSNKQQSNPIRLLACCTQCPTDKRREITGKRTLYLSKSNIINRNTAVDDDSLRSSEFVLYGMREVSDDVSVTSSSFLELVLLFSMLEPVYLHNPSIEEFFALPTNSDCSIHTIGLGQIDSTNEYKVVRALDNRCRKSYNGFNHCEVFTLGSEVHWRIVPCFHEMAYEPSAFAGGGVYMLLSFPDCDKCMVRFDIEHADWTVIAPPEGLFTPPISTYFMRISEVNGLLCLTNMFDDGSIDIWLLKDYKQGIWALNNTIQFSSFVNFLVEELEFPIIYPLSLDYGDGKLLLALFHEFTFPILASDRARKIRRGDNHKQSYQWIRLYEANSLRPKTAVQ